MKKPKSTEKIKMGQHVNKREAFDIAYILFDSLNESCPGCCMSVLSVLLGMLAVKYIKDEKDGGKIFPHEEWIKAIANASIRAVDRCEHMGESVH